MNLPQKTTGSILQPKTPLTDGLSTFGAWFVFGVGLDLVSRKCQFSKSPMKNSLAINGLIGAAAGLFAFYHDKKNSKEGDFMITREVREWLQKVERRQYSYDDAMYEFMRFSSFLTREEMKMIKSKLESSYKK